MWVFLLCVFSVLLNIAADFSKVTVFGGPFKKRVLRRWGVLQVSVGNCQRRHDCLYLHGPHPRETMVLNHGLHPLTTMVLKISASAPGDIKNIEVVAEGDFRTMVLRGCRPWSWAIMGLVAQCRATPRKCSCYTPL